MTVTEMTAKQNNLMKQRSYVEKYKTDNNHNIKICIACDNLMQKIDMECERLRWQIEGRWNNG
jgi:hypothetical protein